MADGDATLFKIARVVLSEPDSARPRTTLVPGDLLAGKYRVERPVGEGRTAVVYEATNLRLEERVALKMLKSEMRADPEMAARFTREAHALAKLRSEHVARAVDVEDLPDGTSIMVMEFLDGQNLEEMLAQVGPLPIEQAADFVIQTCEGLSDAHARGIVHRDVKPENIFIVVRDGWRTVKLLDFGISKAIVSNTASAIRTQSVMGSPVYMSPEQLRSTQSADARADIWSLGAVFFELLTGKTAYEHEQRTLTELITAILEQPARRLAEFRPDLPVDLQSILDRCLEKDLARRYQNTVELAIDLLPFAPSRSRAVVEKALNTARTAGLVGPDVTIPPSTPIAAFDRRWWRRPWRSRCRLRHPLRRTVRRPRPAPRWGSCAVLARLPPGS
jgi:serine/threonine protein kinase